MRKLLTILSLFFCLYGQAQFVGAGAINQQSSRLVPRYSAVAQAAINNMATVPPVATQDNMAILVDGCVTDGNWQFVRYLVAAPMDVQANALSDWIAGVDATTIGSMSFVQYVKWQCPPTGGSINTNYNLITAGTNRDDLSVSTYINDLGDLVDDLTQVGARDIPFRIFLQNDNSSNQIVWITSADNATPGIVYPNNMTVNTYYTIEQSASTTAILYRDGISVSTGATPSAGLPNLDIYWFSVNFNGSPVSESKNTSGSFIVIGTAAIDHVKMNARIETFIAAQAP